MRFASRQDAGRQLGRFLRQRRIAADLVLGLPRGGVIVAAEVAHELQAPLDVMVVRKIGHPRQREFAVGAMAEPDFVFLHEDLLRGFPTAQPALDAVVTEEKSRLRDYIRRFHFSGSPRLEDRHVLLVDDGLATGATMEAAVLATRLRKARKITVAAPVASIDAAERLRRVCNAVEILLVDGAFEAVGQYYEQFDQTTDAEVITLLRDTIARAA